LFVRLFFAALKGYSNDMVAYEFMNEPVADDHEQWNQLVAESMPTPNRLLQSAEQIIQFLKLIYIRPSPKNILKIFQKDI